MISLDLARNAIEKAGYTILEMTDEDADYYEFRCVADEEEVYVMYTSDGKVFIEPD